MQGGVGHGEQSAGVLAILLVDHAVIATVRVEMRLPLVYMQASAFAPCGIGICTKPVREGLEEVDIPTRV